MCEKKIVVLICVVLLAVLCIIFLSQTMKRKNRKNRYEHRQNKNNALNRFYESDTTKLIIDFIKKYPLPYEMRFYNSHIDIYYPGGKATYWFVANGIRNLRTVYFDKKIWCGCIKFHDYVYEHELLARAVNRHFDNAFDFYPYFFNGDINEPCSRLTGTLKDF